MTEEDNIKKIAEYLNNGDILKAKNLSIETINKYPHSSIAHYNLGYLYSTEKKFQKAIRYYLSAIKINPNFDVAYLNIGVAYIRLRKIDKAIRTFHNLLIINPNYIPAYFNLGLAYININQFDKSLEMFEKAHKIDPKDIEVAYQIALLLLNNKRVTASLVFFEKMLKDNPKETRALTGIGEAYRKLGNYQKALSYLEKVQELDPFSEDVLESLFFIYREFCQWDKLESICQKLENKKTQCESPYVNIVRTDNKSQNLMVASYWSQVFENKTKMQNLNFNFKNNKNHQKIRLGYLSSDYRNHPVGIQIVDLFKLHDRNMFEVFTYSYGANDNSIYRKKVEKYSDHFFEGYEKDHKEIAKKINSDEIDILVDLGGYTGMEVLDITSYKPSPIQINYFGFSGTTGANYIDYIIADKIIIPKKDKKFYSEKIIYMPNCYQVTSKNKKANFNYSRSDFGLPENAIVFASFNKPYKIEKFMFDTWINILKKVPNSILWQIAKNKSAKDNLAFYFKKSGLDPKRLIFAENILPEKHLDRLKLANIALDTQIYGGGVTTLNLLWAGVPVITIYGKHYLSRMSSSMLKNIGLSELITKNLKEYKNLTVDLATNPQKLSTIRHSLDAKRLSEPLFNSKLFTKNLEKGYQIAFQNYMQNKKTDIII